MRGEKDREPRAALVPSQMQNKPKMSEYIVLIHRSPLCPPHPQYPFGTSEFIYVSYNCDKIKK